ncbi:MAG: hypothetical protein ABIH72_01330 [archaeon]
MKKFDTSDTYMDSELPRAYYLISVNLQEIKPNHREILNSKFFHGVDYTYFKSQEADELNYLVAQNRLQDFLEAIMEKKIGSKVVVRVPEIKDFARKLDVEQGTFSDS